MKKILLASTLAASLFANDNFIELGFGFLKSKDNFSTEQKKNITTTSSAQEESQALPYVDLYYAYNLTDATNIYLNAGVEGLKLGSELQTGIGLFDIGLKADLMGEEWENPFLTGTNREETDTKEIGVYVGYGLSFAQNHEAMIRYEYSNKTYDKETVANELKREGNRHIIALENMFFTQIFNNKSAILTNLNYEMYKADGKASTYNRYDLELGLSTQLTSNLNLTALVNGGKKDYDSTNPIFNKTVDASIYGVKAVLKYDQPFNYKNTYVTLKTGYEKEDANVDFYDKEDTFAAITFGYKF